MEQAKAAGSEYLFTNPGSFEVGLFDAQITSGVPLIMGLHEGIVVAMADGYHRASLKPAFVNVHVIAGTAQMGGQLYNASRDGCGTSRHRWHVGQRVVERRGYLGAPAGIRPKGRAAPVHEVLLGSPRGA